MHFIKLSNKTFKIVSFFNCEQIHFLSTTQGKQQVARKLGNFERNIVGMRHPAVLFFSSLIDSHYKNGIFDFESRIEYINNKLAFRYYFSKYQLSEGGAGDLTDIINLDITDGGPASVIH